MVDVTQFLYWNCHVVNYTAVSDGGYYMHGNVSYRGARVFVRNFRYFGWKILYNSLPISKDSEFVLS